MNDAAYAAVQTSENPGIIGVRSRIMYVASGIRVLIASFSADAGTEPGDRTTTTGMQTDGGLPNKLLRRVAPGAH